MHMLNIEQNNLKALPKKQRDVSEIEANEELKQSSRKQ
jgi:hypothetical protein